MAQLGTPQKTAGGAGMIFCLFFSVNSLNYIIQMPASQRIIDYILAQDVVKSAMKRSDVTVNSMMHTLESAL